MFRHLRALRVSTLALATLCLLGHSAEAGRFRYTKRSSLGGGTNAQAYLVTHNLRRYQHLTVMKVIRRQSPGHRAQQTMDRGARKRYADKVVKLHRRLRKNSKFTRRFGEIVPETISPRPGVLLQELGEGVTYAELSAKARKRASRERKAARRLAHRLFPDHQFSKYSKNFLFDSRSGRITSWYDILSDKSPVNF